MGVKLMVVSDGLDCQVIGGKLQKKNMMASELDTEFANTKGWLKLFFLKVLCVSARVDLACRFSG